MPASASDLARGVLRLLDDMGFAGVTELPLPTGRRVDVAAVDGAGRVMVVEVKTSLADFTGDAKWREYLDYCDWFCFAVPEDFPRERLPDDMGLMVADGYGAELLRPAPERKANAARRKAVLLRLARAAAKRLRAHEDPQGRASRAAV